MIIKNHIENDIHVTTEQKAIGIMYIQTFHAHIINADAHVSTSDEILEIKNPTDAQAKANQFKLN